ADGAYSAQSLTDVVTGEVGVLLLQQLLITRVAVDQGGHRGAEALLVGTALEGVDRVREGVDGLLVAVVPLQRDLDLVVLALGLEADGRRGDRLLLAEGERGVVVR